MWQQRRRCSCCFLCVHLFSPLSPLVDLLGLLNWRSNTEDLDQILQRLMEVEGSEIVKVCTNISVLKCFRTRYLMALL